MRKIMPLRLILLGAILSLGIVSLVEARTDMPYRDNELRSIDDAPQYETRRRYDSSGHWHRFRHPAYRSGGYFWGYAPLSRWRGDYYWRTIGYLCEGSKCYKRLCLFQTGAVMPVRCETRQWYI